MRVLRFAALAVFLARPVFAQPEDASTLAMLNARKERQLASTNQIQVFHGFRFTDQWSGSEITFQHRVVEDAGKHYKAVHYDHGNGLSVADIDGDALQDIYFTTQLGANQLWRNVGGGKFEDLTQQTGLGLRDQISVAASFADIDNDGDPDLFVTTVRRGNHLFENLGQRRFRDITKEAGLNYSGHSSAGVFFDFDNDGLLDLFLCNVGVYTTNEIGAGGFYRGLDDAFSGHLFPERTEPSILYRNLGGRKFKDVSAECNLRDGSWTGDAAFTDLNGDRFPDLYVLNMQGDDHYYENQGGKRFVEKTASYFPKTPWGSMGLKFFDYNQDGALDLLVTDMHSDMTDLQIRETSSTFTQEFEKKKSESWCTARWTEEYLQGSSNNIFGNALFRNSGSGVFAEVSGAAGTETLWPWGISVGDLNADGYEDVFVTGGMGYGFRYSINSLLLNERGERFADAEFILGVEPRRGNRTRKVAFVLDCSGADKDHKLCEGRTGRKPVLEALSSRSSAIFDLDNDGDLDIVTNEMNDRPQVLVSDLAEKAKPHFIKIKLAGAKSNRDGLGALVKVRADGRTLTQYHDGASGYFGHSSMPLYFGLGDSERAERIEVLWPSGMRQTISSGIPTNALLTVREPAE
jgi:hypothetical protein